MGSRNVYRRCKYNIVLSSSICHNVVLDPERICPSYVSAALICLTREYSEDHSIATLLTHMLATGWAGYQIFNTAQFHGDFSRLSTNGACNPINLLPSYWKSRFVAEIASLVLNAIALLVSSFLSWRLAKVMQSRSWFASSRHSCILLRLHPALWLADFQARRGFDRYQSCL